MASSKVMEFLENYSECSGKKGKIHFLFLETGSGCVAQAGLELPILLPQSPKSWDYRHELHRRTLSFDSSWHIVLCMFTILDVFDCVLMVSFNLFF
jgi:hypothetical protein